MQRSELVSLLQRRNQLAHALAAAARSLPAGPVLPDVLQVRHAQHCPHTARGTIVPGGTVTTSCGMLSPPVGTTLSRAGGGPLA